MATLACFFGNPEYQKYIYIYIQVFKHPELEYGVIFYFQGCDIFVNSKISSYGTPEDRNL